MTLLSLDSELVTAFAAEGSEAAFHPLVARHVNLVYPTALRQVSDADMAEEITEYVPAHLLPRFAELLDPTVSVESARTPE